MASPPAWSMSDGMLSTPADFPIFNALTASSSSSRRISASVGSQVLLPLPRPCKGLSITVHLLRISFSSVRHFPDLSCMVVVLPRVLLSGP